MNQGRHFLSKVVLVAVSALLMCGLSAQSSLAKKKQDSAGPSFGDVAASSTSSSNSKYKSSASAASHYPSDADNMMQYGQPAYGYEAGKAGYYSNGGNGGNNGNQSAVKLPFNSCCGKATRNSAYAAAGLPGGYTTGNGSTPAFNPMANSSYTNQRSAYVGANAGHVGAATNYGTSVPGMTQAGVAGGGNYGGQVQVPGMKPMGGMNGGSVPLQYGSSVPGTSF